MHLATQNKERPPIHNKLGRRSMPFKVRHSGRRRTLRLTGRSTATDHKNKKRKEYRDTKFFHVSATSEEETSPILFVFEWVN